MTHRGPTSPGPLLGRHSLVPSSEWWVGYGLRFRSCFTKNLVLQTQDKRAAEISDQKPTLDRFSVSASAYATQTLVSNCEHKRQKVDTVWNIVCSDAFKSYQSGKFCNAETSCLLFATKHIPNVFPLINEVHLQLYSCWRCCFWRLQWGAAAGEKLIVSIQY